MTASLRLRLMGASALAIFFAGSAWAQTAPTPNSPLPDQSSAPQATPSADADDSTIPDVIVTANKREENAQKVAAAVAAVSQETVTRQGVKDITDINRAIPEVNVNIGSLATVAIRGVGSLGPGPTLESPSAVHLDGAYVGRFTTLQGLFFDVQRLEVLEGPQGTLYGRNSAGGTLNIITVKPSQELGGYASFEYGNYNAKTATGVINLPITSTLAVRAAYYHNDHDGYLTNGYLDTLSNSGRLSALWKPTDRDTLTVTADLERIHGHQRGGASVLTQVYVNPTILQNANGSYSRVAAGTPGGVVVPIRIASGKDDATTLVGALDQGHLDTQSGGYMAQYDHDTGGPTLTAQIAYRYVHYNHTNGSLTGYLQDPRITAAGVIRPIAPNSFEIGNAQQNTQELRLTSPSNQTFTYVLGAFRFYERSYDNYLGSYLTRYGNNDANGAAGTFTIPTPLIYNTRIGNPLQTDEAYGFFGQATLSPFGPVGLHVTGGIRYNLEEKHGIGFTVLNTVADPNGTYDARSNEAGVTYKANVSYDLTDHNLIYVDNSTGFSAGGFAYGVNPIYPKSTITAYEFGSKNRFFDNRVLFNFAIWHYDYENLPVQITSYYINAQTGLPAGSPTVDVAKRAKIDGQSASFEARVTRNDTLTANATHLNPRFTDFNLINDYQVAISRGILIGATPAQFNYSGSKIGFDFEWAANGSYNHVFRDVLGGEINALASIHYQGKRLLAPLASLADANQTIFSRPLTTVDFLIGYRPHNGRFSLQAYVRNMFDSRVSFQEAYVSNAVYLPASDPRVQFAYRAVTYTPPRLFGAIARIDF